jgi:uncharacterized protein (TIGR00255 family)
MTGQGRGSAERDGHRVTVEVRAVNHRFLDLKVRTVGMEARLDEVLLPAIRRHAERGSFSVAVRDEPLAGRAYGLRVDLAAARQVHAALEELRQTLGSVEPVSLALIAAQPGVLVPGEAEPGESGVAAIVQAIDAAMADLVSMRRREGAVLAADLEQRISRLESLVSEIAEHAAVAPSQLRQRLTDRIEKLLQGGTVTVDEVRLATEVALLADRADVTEELVRLRAHLHALGTLVREDAPVGRRMDFLVQEVGREVNTIGSKSPAIEISRRVVEAKAEVEKIREQVQNVE